MTEMFWHGITYQHDNPTEIIAALQEHPEAVADYEAAMYRHCQTLTSAGDYVTAAEAFEAMCRVLSVVRPGINYFQPAGRP